MMKRYYIIIGIINCFKIISIFEPNLTFIKSINKNLSLPYYAQFNKKPDKSGLYSLWISNNPYGSKLAKSGYITQFKYNPENNDFIFTNKICTPNILGLAACKKEDTVYPGIKSYPAASINSKYILDASVKPQFSTYNFNLLCCHKNEKINSYTLGGLPSNIAFSAFKYIFNGVKYQILIIPYNIIDQNNQEVIGNVAIFDYALNKSILNQPLTPITQLANTSNSPILVPSDAKLSPFADINGNYLLAVSNANSPSLSLFKVNISNVTNMSINFYQSINIGNYQQHFISFSNNRYLAVGVVDVGENNLYVYYFDENFNITALNNGLPYKTGNIPQALTWSPDAKTLIIPNYLDNNFTVYQANTCDIKVKLTPKVTTQYPNSSSIITATVQNGTPPYTFYFSTGQTITQESNVASIKVSPEQTTVYNVTVVDANNCITGIANPITIEVARPVITKIVPNCNKSIVKIYGKILNANGTPLICTTIELFINNQKAQKIFVTSDKAGNFKLKYKVKN